ncbi:MAG: sulfotransferase family 2 domain-containing protein [Bauldia sp.]|nr:sulfotransferase family 2 domain-containing protein [Bauldia sp.]
MSRPRVFLGLPESRVVLCLTPKVGSQSIISAMMRHYGIEPDGLLHLNPALPFMTREDVERYVPDWRRAMFVRNPFDRLAANFHYHIRLTELRRSRNMRDLGYSLGMSFGDFARKACHHPDADPHTALQSRMAGRVSFVGKIESSAWDWDRFSAFLGLSLPPLPRVNQNADRPHYREDYTDELQALVARAYKADLDLFGYAF